MNEMSIKLLDQSLFCQLNKNTELYEKLLTFSI
jgi:hypothetical protein